MEGQELFDLNKDVEVLERPLTFLLNKFFGEVQDPDGTKIMIDMKRRKRKLAPFVSHLVEGVPVAEGGFSTLSLDPAYFRLKDAPSQVNTRKRRFGQRQGEKMSPQQQLEEDTMDVLDQHENSIQQTLEWMAANALVSGSYLVYSEHFPKYQVDFQRNANNTITIGTPWSDVANATPIDDLDDMSKVVFEGCGLTMTDVTMDLKSYKFMIKNPDVKELFQFYNGVNGAELPSITPEAYKTVSYKGKLGSYDIWVYEGNYDDNGVSTRLIPEGTVIGASPEGLQGFIGHGEIQNDKAVEAGLAEQTRFVDRFFDDNVGKKQVQTETAPLVVPANPDASASMNVL